MSNREVKVFYFKSDQDITAYLLNLKNITNPENSIEYRGNHIQLRDVKKKGEYIVGRICKVREVEKPMTGKVNDPEENYLEADIIESSNFIYNKKNRHVIIQNNSHVSTNPNSLLSKLIVKTQQNLNGLGIPAIIRDDAVEELIKNRGSITKINIKTTKEGANIIAKESGDDVEMGDSFLNSASYTERTLSYKMNIGSVEESFIKKAYKWFKSKKVSDASFTIDGNRSPIKLSEFAKYETLSVEVDKGSFNTSDFQDKLSKLMDDDEK